MRLAAALVVAMAAMAAPAADSDPAPRAGRHALLIGVGQYRADPARPVEPLAGVRHDMVSARTIATRLQVPPDQIVQLQDAEATRERIEQAIAALTARVRPGDRVFLYWSGHGSRHFDATEGGCVESLITHDLRDLGFRELAALLRPLADKTDKLLVVYDACHSGGARVAGTRTASRLRPRSAGLSAQCSQPSNVRSRSLDSASRGAGIGPGDVVHIASSRPDEVSFDDPRSGGLATVALTRCLQGEARDLDGSGAVSAEELVRCAQGHVETALRSEPGLLPHHLTLAGNRQFVPAQFAATRPAPGPAAPGPSSPPALPAPLPLPELLQHLHAQRDGKHRVEATLSRARLRIGHDALELAVTSGRGGRVHLVQAGSDGSLTLLFPNELDRDNRIEPGQTLWLPRPTWRLVAGGPAGRSQLLVAITDAERDLTTLGGGRAGPFTRPLTDAAGRSRLHAWLTQCSGRECRDAFGSALLEIEETP